MVSRSGAVGRIYSGAPRAQVAGAGGQERKQRSTQHKATLLSAKQRKKPPPKQLRDRTTPADFNPFNCLAGTEDGESDPAEPAQDWEYSQLGQAQSPHPELPSRTAEGGWILYSHSFKYEYSLTGDILFSPIERSLDIKVRVQYEVLPETIIIQDRSFYGEWRAMVRKHQEEKTAAGPKLLDISWIEERKVATRKHQEEKIETASKILNRTISDGTHLLDDWQSWKTPLPEKWAPSRSEYELALYPRDSLPKLVGYRLPSLPRPGTFRREIHERRERIEPYSSYEPRKRFERHERRRELHPRLRRLSFTYSAYPSRTNRRAGYEYMYPSPSWQRKGQAVRLWKKPGPLQRQLEIKGHSENPALGKAIKAVHARRHESIKAFRRQKRVSNGNRQSSKEKTVTGQTYPRPEKLLAYIGAVSYSSLCGAQSLSAWRHNAGRKKEWRKCESFRSKQKRPAERLRAAKHKDFYESYQKHDYAWVDPVPEDGEKTINESEDLEEWMLHSVPEDAKDVSLAATSSGQTKIHLSAASFTGAVVGSSYRLTRYLRSENHGDVFAAEDLNVTSHHYEAKAYTFLGSTRALYDYRRRNLRKIEKSNNFVRSIKHGGKIYAITRVNGSTQHNYSTFIRQRSGIGAIGRRNTPEFNAAFPPLPRPTTVARTRSHQFCSKPLMKADSEGRLWVSLGTTQDDTRAKNQDVREVDPSQLLGMIQAAYAKQEASNGQTMLGATQDEILPKKLKTEQQLERRRVKQREWRARKRAKKAACVAPAAAEEPPKNQEEKEEEEEEDTPAPNARVRLPIPPRTVGVPLPTPERPFFGTSNHESPVKASMAAPVTPEGSKLYPQPASMGLVSLDSALQDLSRFRESLAAQHKLLSEALVETPRRRKYLLSQIHPNGNGSAGADVGPGWPRHPMVPKAVRNTQSEEGRRETPSVDRAAPAAAPARPNTPLDKELTHEREMQKRFYSFFRSDFFDK